MTAIADLLSARDRERLAARMREFAELEQLVREIPEQRPAPSAPALAEIARRTDTTRSTR